MDLKMEQIEKMPLAQKALVLVVIIVAVGSLWYYLIYSKKKVELTNLSNKYQELQQKAENLSNKQKEMKALKNNIDLQKKEVMRYKEKLPTQTQMDQLLIQIDEIGKKNGLFFETFKPKKPADRENTYTEVPIDLDFTGMYPYVMNFFFETVSMKRIVKFNRIKITLGKKSGGSGGAPQVPGQVKVTCEASIYKFLAEKAAPPPAAPAPGGAGTPAPAAGGAAPAAPPPAAPGHGN